LDIEKPNPVSGAGFSPFECKKCRKFLNCGWLKFIMVLVGCSGCIDLLQIAMVLTDE